MDTLSNLVEEPMPSLAAFQHREHTPFQYALGLDNACKSLYCIVDIPSHPGLDCVLEFFRQRAIAGEEVVGKKSSANVDLDRVPATLEQ
ncbi:hypothetical protein MMC14_009716 [Varicellaria rhodocarpa]|nr:hypothetical protein [Varicellaria rhodocarpa]